MLKDFENRMKKIDYPSG